MNGISVFFLYRATRTGHVARATFPVACVLTYLLACLHTHILACLHAHILTYDLHTSLLKYLLTTLEVHITGSGFSVPTSYVDATCRFSQVGASRRRELLDEISPRSAPQGRDRDLAAPNANGRNIYSHLAGPMTTGERAAAASAASTVADPLPLAIPPHARRLQIESGTSGGSYTYSYSQPAVVATETRTLSLSLSLSPSSSLSLSPGPDPDPDPDPDPRPEPKTNPDPTLALALTLT